MLSSSSIDELALGIADEISDGDTPTPISRNQQINRDIFNSLPRQNRANVRARIIAQYSKYRRSHARHSRDEIKMSVEKGLVLMEAAAGDR